MLGYLEAFRRRRNSLQGRIVTSVGAALLLILAVFVIIALWALHQGMEEAFQSRVTLAHVYATQVDQTLGYVTDVLETDTGTLRLSPGGLSEEQRALLTGLRHRIGPAATLTVADADGTVLWTECADPCRDGGASAIRVRPFDELAPRRPLISEQSDDAAVFARIDLLLVDNFDQAMGVLVADVDPRHPSLLLLPSPDATQGIEPALITTDGRLVVGPESSRSRAPSARLAAQAHARLIAETPESTPAGYLVHDQIPGLLPSGHVVAFAPLSSLPSWVVTVEQPVDQVFELPTRVQWYLALSSGATLAGVMLLAMLDVRRVTAPLRRLSVAAERLSIGSFDDPIAIGGTDEIGELGRTLDTMRVQLRDLVSRERNVAVLEERERIAREMHDGLGQVLGYVIMKSLAVAQLIDIGDIAGARAQVDQLGTAAQEAYADVRENILALRTTLAPDRDLVSALRAYVAGFERQSEISVELTVHQEHGDVWTDPTAEVQLLRIVQEALTNVRKHADAQRVSVQLTIGSEHLQLEVADDGRGLDLGRPTVAASSHFGLQVMRGRAEGIGGTFDLQSQVGRGTRVTVTLPVRRRGEADGADTHPPRR